MNDTLLLWAARLVCACCCILPSFLTAPAQERLGAYAHHAREGRSILFLSADGQTLRITPYGAAIIRVQASRKGEALFPDDRYEMIERHDWDGALALRDEGARFVLETSDTSGLRVAVGKYPLRVTFLDRSGRVLLGDRDGVVWKDSTIGVSFACDDREHFTGLGHNYYARSPKIDLKGEEIRRNYGSAHSQQAPLLVPFYLSSKGYGLFLNSTFQNRFSFGKDGVYDCAIDSGGRMDYFFINGPDFSTLLERYTRLTGRPRLPARAFFGLALSDKGADHTASDPSDEAWWKKKITAHRDAGFAIDHIVNDNRWRAGGGKRCESFFAWDTVRYPDPAEYERWVKSNGLVVTIDLNRCISSHSEGWDRSYNIPHPEGIDFADSAPDLTKRAVREWFWGLFWKKSLDTSLGYPGDALWIDEFDEMGRAPLSMTLADGRQWREMKNYWFFLVAKALVADGWDRAIGEAKRPFVWVRGMTAGAQRYATLWSGDIRPSYDDMRMQIVSMQLAGLSGFPYWGHDAGGFHNYETHSGPDEPMYQQWSMAMGSFSPYWKPHGMGQSRWPLDRSAESQRIARHYLDLRYRLMPYTYTYAHEAAATGIPIARAMVIGHEQEPEAWKHDLQYMWGASMLIAPNASESTAVDLWLPEGAWYDFRNDANIEGGRMYRSNAEAGMMPVFVKEGAVIPMAPYALGCAFIPQDTLALHIYTGKDGSFTLYEDDGVSERYRTRGEYRTTAMVYTESKKELTIAPASGAYANAPNARSYRVVFHGIPPKRYSRIEIDGKSVGRRKPGDAPSPQSVWKDEGSVVTITIPQRPVAEKTVVRLIVENP